LHVVGLDLQPERVEFVGGDCVPAAFCVPVGEGSDAVQAAGEGGEVSQVQVVEVAVEELVPVELVP
jgi:hypothetical protein